MQERVGPLLVGSGQPRTLGRATVPGMTTAQLPTLRLGGRHFSVVLPNRRDPRLHLAAVIISIHIIGVTALGFQVSVPQILAAIVACALIEVGWTLYQTGNLVWPASALLTGSGIALILRVVGTESGDYWSWRGWYLFAAVGALALFTKYVVRYHGTHVFNPSNVALVAVFLLMGSSRVEPLDFWWAPLDGWMLAAYAVILAGGLLITSRMGLLPMAGAFWVTLVAGLGLLAVSGHCITARWALQPVCGSEFWWVLATSPEILIFLFFMITDPKTIPAGRVARVVFAVGIALLCTLLIAPQTTEFGAKVALLAGLVLMSPLRRFFDRYFPEAVDRSRLGEFVAAVTTSGGVDIGSSRTFIRGGIGASLVIGVGILVVVAGAPAREPAQAVPALQEVAVDVVVDPATLPAPTIDAEVAALNSDIDAETADDLAMMLAENLEIEAEAMRRRERVLLLSVDFGARLAEMQRRVDRSMATGEWVAADYRFDTLHLRVVVTAGGQGADLGFDATGVIDATTYDAYGVELRRNSGPFASTFVLRQGNAARWLILDEVDVVEGLTTLGLGRGDGRVLTVPGEYPSIMAAIEAAPDGAVVEIAPGRYTETVTVTRPLKLRGLGGKDAAQLVGDGQGPVIEIAGTINVTVEGLAVSNGRVGILVRESQGVVISQNVVENNELRGIDVINASAEIVGNMIRGTQAPFGIGIHIANASAWPSSVVEDNLVEANGRAGITTNFANVLIRRNTVRANGGRGISVREMSVVRLVDNEIVENRGTEVLVIDGSTAQLEGNTIDASSVLGHVVPIPIQVEFYAAADLIENVIGPHAPCAISIGMGSEISGEGNRWPGDLSGCDPLPMGLFAGGG